MQEEIDIEKKAHEFYHQLGPSGDKVITFFICFSKFESALKQAGYTDWNESQKRLSPHWDNFIKDITTEFDNRIAGQEESMLNEAVRYFHNKPPKKQVLRDGQIDWKDPEDRCKSLKQLIDSIHRVRNNLFHGGKYPYSRSLDASYLDEPARDDLLLSYSLAILQECLELCGSAKLQDEARDRTRKLREFFEHPILDERAV